MSSIQSQVMNLAHSKKIVFQLNWSVCLSWAWKKIKTRKKALKIAAYLLTNHGHKEAFSTFLKCLKMAFKRINIISELRKGETKFTFTKKNGQERPAIGSLAQDVFSSDKKKASSKPTKPTNFSIVKYYDLEKNAWRSFKLETFKNFN